MKISAKPEMIRESSDVTAGTGDFCGDGGTAAEDGGVDGFWDGMMADAIPANCPFKAQISLRSSLISVESCSGTGSRSLFSIWVFRGETSPESV
jgi:hypothetical protein